MLGFVKLPRVHLATEYFAFSHHEASLILNYCRLHSTVVDSMLILARY